MRLADASEAVGVLGLVLDDAPTEVVALEAEVAFLRRLGRDREAGLALERLAEVAPEPDAKAALWRAAAAARDRTGSRPGEALSLWERIVDARPTIDALTVMERHAVRRGDWARVVLARRKLAEAAPTARRAPCTCGSSGLAHLAAGDLGRRRRLRARRRRRSDVPAGAARARRLREAMGETRAAAELFARLGGSRRRARAPPTRSARGAPTRPTARTTSWRRAPSKSAGARARGRGRLPGPEAILRARADTDRLAQVMRRRAATGTVAQRRDRLLALAALLRERDANDAAAALAEAVELDPSSVQALARLAEVQAELGRPAEAVASLQRVIAASPDSRVVSASWVRVGDIAERDLADVGVAVEAYRSALLSIPDDVRALTGLVRGLSRRRDWANAALTLRRLATVDPDREARVITSGAGRSARGRGRGSRGRGRRAEQALLLDPGTTPPWSASTRSSRT